MSHWDQSEGVLEKLSQVALKGAEYDSLERQPHPKCLKGTRVYLLDYIYELSDNTETSQLIWLNGTAGVGKSAVAFTVAERMRGLKVTERRPREKRLAGTFFFSRKHMKHCTTGYLFATLAYQLASNFTSIQDDVNRAMHENPALLDPDGSLHIQMEELFLQPLRRLQLRLYKCPPVVFVIDALDECTSKAEVADLISLLGQALRDPDLPVIHILLTSRPEAHIRDAIHGGVRSLVCEIPMNTSGKGVTSLISLDGANVDNDIYLFLKHSFTELRNRHPELPQPTQHELERLTSRSGRRFIVASTMMKFIDDGHNDPRSRLQLILKFTSDLLPATEVYKLYDRILATCADPKRAYLHLSVVAALANPLPISQISELLGPGEGRDVEKTLVQLRSVLDIPTDSGLPVNIYHSSVRDYVLEPSNCSHLKEQYITSPHSLLARSSLYLMIHDIPESTGLLDALMKLKTQSRAMESHAPQSLRHSLAFIVEPPTALRTLIALLWLRKDRSPQSYSWLETLDGRAWLRTQGGENWLKTHGRLHWLQTRAGLDWLQSPSGRDWTWIMGLQVSDLETPNTDKLWPNFEQVLGGQSWLFNLYMRYWLQTSGGQYWLQTPGGRRWLQTLGGQEWLQFRKGDWLQTPSGRQWLQTPGARVWLQTPSGREWLQTSGEQEWLQTSSGREWLQTPSGREWLQTQSGREWLQYRRGDWLQTSGGREWLQTQSGREWLQTKSGHEWLQTHRGGEWLQTLHGQTWQSTPVASFQAHMEEFLDTVEAISELMIVPEMSFLPAFQAIQQFKSLPDFLMFPAFLTLTPRSPTSALAQGSDMEIIHVIKAFETFANETRQRSRLASDALIYACQNWAIHLSRSPSPWDNKLNRTFKVFWDDHLLSWLERQWCLRGLRSCLIVLSEGQKLAQQHRSALALSQSSL